MEPSLSQVGSERDVAPLEIRRVLIVEDDAQIAEVMAAMLRMVCDEVTIVHTMADCMDALRVSSFSLVLLDLVLPDSRARDTLEAIPAIKAAGAPRVVCVTGTDIGDSVRNLARDNGAEKVLAKMDDLGRELPALFGVPNPS